MSAAESGRKLHDEVQLVQRRTRIERRRRRLAELRAYAFPPGSAEATRHEAEIARFQQEIRDEGEEP